MDGWVNLVQHPVWFQVRVSWKGIIAWSPEAGGKQGALLRGSSQPSAPKDGCGYLLGSFTSYSALMPEAYRHNLCFRPIGC